MVASQGLSLMELVRKACEGISTMIRREDNIIREWENDEKEYTFSHVYVVVGVGNDSPLLSCLSF
jgi:hypothetical protein